MYIKFGKRALDIVLSCIGMIILCIPMLIVVIIIKAEDSGPAIFKQERIGIHKSRFILYKFRSMKMGTPDIPTPHMEHQEQYTTKFGAFIRRTSIDELPQLWNIFKGDMSIIGPRPALWNEYDLIEERDKYGANDVKPGLTGWAQINGRNKLSMKAKAAYDGDYAKRMNFLFDCKCFIGSVIYVIKEEGISAGEKGTSAKQSERQQNNLKENPRL